MGSVWIYPCRDLAGAFDYGQTVPVLCMATGEQSWYMQIHACIRSGFDKVYSTVTNYQSGSTCVTQQVFENGLLEESAMFGKEYEHCKGYANANCLQQLSFETICEILLVYLVQYTPHM